MPLILRTRGDPETRWACGSGPSRASERRWEGPPARDSGDRGSGGARRVQTHSAGDLVPRGSIAQNKYEIGGSFPRFGRSSRSSEVNSDTAKKFVPGEIVLSRLRIQPLIAEIRNTPGSKRLNVDRCRSRAETAVNTVPSLDILVVLVVLVCPLAAAALPRGASSNGCAVASRVASLSRLLLYSRTSLPPASPADSRPNAPQFYIL